MSRPVSSGILLYRHGPPGLEVLLGHPGGPIWHVYHPLDEAGETWESVVLGRKQTLLNVAFANDKEGWVVGWNGAILRTGDGGRTWVEQESGTKNNLYGVSVRKNQVWAVGAQGLVLKYITER